MGVTGLTPLWWLHTCAQYPMKAGHSRKLCPFFPLKVLALMKCLFRRRRVRPIEGVAALVRQKAMPDRAVRVAEPQVMPDGHPHAHDGVGPRGPRHATLVALATTRLPRGTVGAPRGATASQKATARVVRGPRRPPLGAPRVRQGPRAPSGGVHANGGERVGTRTAAGLQRRPDPP